MPNPTRTRWLVDIGLGAGLCIVLIVIAALEPRSRKPPPSVEVAAAAKTPKEKVELPKPAPPVRANAPRPTPKERIPVQQAENEPAIPLTPRENEPQVPITPRENEPTTPLKPGENQVEFLGVKARGKRFCIIADNSGSMGGAKIDALRNELLKTLGDFEKGGEFYIYCFNSDVEPMPHRTWLTASAPECAGIRRWIREIDVKGGTEPAPAFDAAFRLDPLPDIIYFMTDGMIPREVPAHVERLNRGQPKVVIHTIMFGKGWFSEGAEAGLVKIADQSGGTFSRRGIEGSDSGPGLAAASVCGSCLCVLFVFAVFIALGSSVLRSLFTAGKPGRRRRRR